MNILIEMGAILLASALAMIFHELPKSIAYILTGRHLRAEDKKKIWQLYRYIDPIGWIFFVTCHVGVSRPYAYRLKEKDTNVAVGLTGFFSLIIMILGSYVLYHLTVVNLPATVGWDADSLLWKFVLLVNWYFLYASAVLLIVNLIPFMSSDISLLIIALSPKTLIPLLKNDTMIKGLFIIALVFGWISNLALSGIHWLDVMFNYV